MPDWPYFGFWLGALLVFLLATHMVMERLDLIIELLLMEE